MYSFFLSERSSDEVGILGFNFGVDGVVPFLLLILLYNNILINNGKSDRVNFWRH